MVPTDRARVALSTAGTSAPPSPVPPEARAAILAWYRVRGRPLAFRRTDDPYAILVSEAMAQQTQAARAADHWERFMTTFPTVESLADATPAAVLRAWAGLGYDRRALALHRSARVIVDVYGGRVPSSIPDLEALPGVGPYTARAVAALAYGRPVGAVDVNVRRVLGRIAAGAPDVLSASTLQAIADASVPPDEPGTWTHAVMDLGATVCRPRAPRCRDCPARAWCRFAGSASHSGLDEPDGTRRSTPRRAVSAGRDRPAPFHTTNRWLRGRILDRLRSEPGDAWVTLDGGIGGHDHHHVRDAATAMARDGVLELEPRADDILRARLPLS